jgi:hypothetical protein
VIGVQSTSQDDPGDVTCLNARKAEPVRCGTIHSIGRITYAGGVYFDGMRFATYASQYGDSGGATHSPLGSGVTAYGVQSGCTNMVGTVCQGYGVYSHIGYIVAELGVTVCTLSNPCP